MTCAERGKFSTIFNAQSNETSDKKHTLQRCLSPAHADQEDTASVLERYELLEVTEESQAQILKYDLEIPPQAKTTSIPFSSLPPKIQQLMLSRAKHVSKTRHTTEIPNVTYIWPVIKVEEASRPFWENFKKSLVPTSSNLTGHSSSPDLVSEDVKCLQTAPVKELSQEELDRKTARSYTLLVKSCNSVVSGILKSLTNIKNKDFKNVFSLSSISPIGEQLKIHFFKGNAIVIYDGQLYILYEMRHEFLSPEMKMFGRDMSVMTTRVWLITCRGIHDLMIEVPHPLLSSQYVVKQDTEGLIATSMYQGKTSDATQVSSHFVTAISQLKHCPPSTGNKQQFLNKPAFPFTEGLQKRYEKETRQEDNALRKKFGIVKDVRVHLNRISVLELTGKASTFKWKALTKPTRTPNLAKAENSVSFAKEEVIRAIEVIAKKRQKDMYSNQRCSAVETMKKTGKKILYTV